MNSLEIIDKLLKSEKEDQPLYKQLRIELENTRYQRAANFLCNLQRKQIDILETLMDELEEELPSPPADEIYYAQHILQPGENLRILAREYNTTVAKIKELNPKLTDTPEAGQLIYLPIKIPKPPAQHIKYYVQPGDTLYEIAQEYDTTVDALVRINNIADPDIIFPGRILIIPCA
ncbi:putative glycosyl hydrolase [Halobacteroides halobius DSM 5150]|uniref:Putative glycosyl hydrolase n=1 Tax=Halobacteroides halobius (strain ATCC 35273 / DSM 5150 / MD-1) TaxID=748449 RepID=L0K8L2_HALHC|nr:LysM domain-containing protein [Halobacteroides halobius]AGB41627.1 putative glycosyl hydrolase [Halobacteroides halobius DSM 5150]